MTNGMHSEFLTPQKLIEDPIGNIDMLPLMVVQRNYFKKENEEPIPQNLFDLADKLFLTLEPDSQPYSQVLLPTETVYDGYKWTQNENLITITYISPDDVSENDIKITESSISSPFLSGNFFDTVSNPQVSISNKKVTITLTVSRKFLVLIKSGQDMDKYSQFFLAAYATKVGQMDLFDKLLIKSATKNLTMAMTALAVSYLQREEREKAIYWFYIFGKATNEYFAYLSIADSLLQLDASRYVFLVENILITIAPKFPQAYTFLARLHLDSIPGFNSSDTLAAQYLEYSVRNIGTPESLRMLAQLYVIGRGVKKDVHVGSELLRESGLSEGQVKEAIQLFNEIEAKRRSEKGIANDENNESIVDTIADYSISAAVVVGLVAAGVYLYSHFMNRRK